MNYIKRNNEGIERDGITMKKSLISYLNKLCLQSGSSLQGRLDFGKYLLNTTKIPIYINKDIILFPTESIRRYNSVLINYKNIISYNEIDDFIRVVFKDLREIYVNISMYSFEKQVEKAHEINEYLS